MTSIVLSQATQDLINTALSGSGGNPGVNNANYIAAYNAVSAEINANGQFNSGTAYWFSQAGAVNSQFYQPTPAGNFIWTYTQAAAASYGVTVTPNQLLQASNGFSNALTTALNGINSLGDITTVTTSADGLSTTLAIDTNGDCTTDETRRDVTELGADGSRTETITDGDANGAQLDQQVIITSANGLTVTTTTAGAGQNVTVQTVDTVIAFRSRDRIVSARNNDAKNLEIVEESACRLHHQNDLAA